jgi:hypothetical protein
MEQQGVIRFFTLKGLKARAIHTELESVHVPDAPALPTGISGGNAFTKGKRICLTIPGPEGP